MPALAELTLEGDSDVELVCKEGASFRAAKVAGKWRLPQFDIHCYGMSDWN